MGRALTRRRFLRRAAAAGGAALVGITSAVGADAEDPPARSDANSRIGLGFVGVGPRGGSLLSAFMGEPDVEVAAVCDVYAPRVEQAVERTNGRARGYRDFRDLLEDDNVDAVIIATPVHWHALPAIYACMAGKDVYVEKPLTHNIAEGRALVRAARENRRVTQMGTQIHAGENFHRVVEIVRSGILGKITLVRTWLVCNEAPNGIGHPPDADPPDGLDWDTWLGPAPECPFNHAKFEGGHFRYFWDYGGGWLTAMGPHIVDLPFWALELGSPRRIVSVGGKHAVDDCAETPDTQHVLYEFDGLTMTWGQTSACSYGYETQGEPGMRRRLGIMFHGTNGSLVADYTSHRIFPEGDRMEGADPPEPYLPRPKSHHREFLDCVRTRELASCDVEYAHRVTAACHLGNIALRAGRSIEWDGESERIAGDDEAQRLVSREYRRPWRLPD